MLPLCAKNSLSTLCSHRQHHSQTLLNKSSPPPKPLLCEGLAADEAATGSALLHPPKSSSCVTVGAGLLALTPSLLPQPPKSFCIDVVAGALYDDALAIVAVCFGAAGAGVGSGAPHASVDPQASMLLNPDEAGGFAFGAGAGAGAERLKAVLLYEGIGAAGLLTAAGVGAGAPKSNKSPMVEAAGGGGFAFTAGGAADVKSPKSPNPLGTR